MAAPGGALEVRRVDEILGVYANQGAAGKRYLLRSLERQAATVDSQPVLDLLHRELDAEVADYARPVEDTCFARVERDRLIRAGGGASGEAGDWSRFFAAGELTGKRNQDQDLEKAAAPRLAPLVAALGARIERGAPDAAACLRILARIRIPRSLEILRSTAEETSLLLPACIAALSVFGGPEAARHALDLARTWEGTPLFAGLVYSFRGLGDADVFGLLARKAEEPELQISVAAALEGFGSYPYGRLIDKILASDNQWAILHLIESLGRIGSKEANAQLLQAFFRVEHPLVKVACLQSLAAADAVDGGDAAMMALRHKHPLVQAAAIEALIRLPVSQSTYRDQVLDLLDSKHSRVAMNAALACVVLDSRRALQKVGEMLKDPSAAHLTQGIHCLAYMEHPSSASLLATLTRRAPSGPLRLQAVRSLGRRAAENLDAAKELAGLLEYQDPAVRATTAWFLAGCVPASRKGAVAALHKALAMEQDPEVEAAMIQAIGLAGPVARDSADDLVPLLESPGARVRRSAAWTLVSAFPDSPAAASLDKHASGPLQPWNLLRRWYLEGTGMDALATCLASSDPATVEEALEVARRAAEVTVFAAEPETLRGLASVLGEARKSLPPEPRSSTTTPRAAIVAQPSVALVASGRILHERAASGGEAELPAQIIPQEVAGTRLPSLEETAQALEARAPSEAEALIAVEEASYYSLPKPVVPPSSYEIPVAAKAPEDAGALLKLVVFAFLALVLGQAIRFLRM